MKNILKDYEKINKHYYEIGKLEGKREALLKAGEVDLGSPVKKFEEFLMSFPFDGHNTQEILRELHEKISILMINTSMTHKDKPSLRILDDDITL